MRLASNRTTQNGFTDYRTVLRNWKEAHHEVRFLFCSITDFGVIDDQHVKVIIDDTFVLEPPQETRFPHTRQGKYIEER